MEHYVSNRVCTSSTKRTSSRWTTRGVLGFIWWGLQDNMGKLLCHLRLPSSLIRGVESRVSNLNVTWCRIFLHRKSVVAVDEDFGRSTHIWTTKYTLELGADVCVEILRCGVSGPGSLNPIVPGTRGNWVTVITGHESVCLSVCLKLRSCLKVDSCECMHVMDRQRPETKWVTVN